MNEEQRQDFFAKQTDAIEKQVDAALTKGEHSYVYYSAYPFDHDTEVITNNLDDVAIIGQVRMVHEYEEFWNEDLKGETYCSEIMNNPTWLQLTVAYNTMLITTRDFHHIFFEGVKPTDKTIDGIQTFDFIMGS